MQNILHYFGHLVLPLLIACIFFKENIWRTYFIFLATMLVDADHLLANPVYDASRCSIGFHLLHSYWAIGLYALMLFPKPTRIIAIGLLMHMLTDAIDCRLMTCCN
jgi:hypothetical protein